MVHFDVSRNCLKQNHGWLHQQRPSAVHDQTNHHDGQRWIYVISKTPVCILNYKSTDTDNDRAQGISQNVQKNPSHVHLFTRSRLLGFGTFFVFLMRQVFIAIVTVSMALASAPMAVSMSSSPAMTVSVASSYGIFIELLLLIINYYLSWTALIFVLTRSSCRPASLDKNQVAIWPIYEKRVRPLIKVFKSEEACSIPCNWPSP